MSMQLHCQCPRCSWRQPFCCHPHADTRSIRSGESRSYSWANQLHPLPQFLMDSMHLYSAATGTDIEPLRSALVGGVRIPEKTPKVRFIILRAASYITEVLGDSSNKLNNTISKKFPFLSPTRANVLPVQIDQYTTLSALSAFSVLKEGWSLKHPSFYGWFFHRKPSTGRFVLVGRVTPSYP